MNNIMKKLKNGEVLFIDGGFGTEIHKLGFAGDPALANLQNPEAVTEVHRQYAVAGADIVTANTFGAYSHKYNNYAEMVKAAVACARDGSQGAAVALDLGPTGLQLEPYGDATVEEVGSIFAATIAAAEKSVDLIIVETMMDINELEIAVCKAKTTGLPVFATMTFNPNGRTMYGASIADMVELLERLEVDALGINCSEGPEGFAVFVPQLLAATKLPVAIQPNAGLPIMVDGKPTYNLPPAEYATFMADMQKQGVAILGGCCGTTPAHIAAMKKAI